VRSANERSVFSSHVFVGHERPLNSGTQTPAFDGYAKREPHLASDSVATERPRCEPFRNGQVETLALQGLVRKTNWES
jgi:hypothetical protein